MPREILHINKNRFKELLKETGYKQKDVAEHLLVSPQHFSAIVNGQYGIDRAYLEQLADFFLVDWEYLCGLSDTKYDYKRHDNDEIKEIDKSIERMLNLGGVDCHFDKDGRLYIEHPSNADPYIMNETGKTLLFNQILSSAIDTVENFLDILHGTHSGGDISHYYF